METTPPSEATREHTLTAILPCNDLDRTEAFYKRLGFTRDDGGAYADYRILADGKGGHLHLNPAVEGWVRPSENPFGIYLYCEDIDALAASFPGEILGSVKAPEDKPWGMYEFALSDPDGVLVRIGWPTRLRKNAAATVSSSA